MVVVINMVMVINRVLVVINSPHIVVVIYRVPAWLWLLIVPTWLWL